MPHYYAQNYAGIMWTTLTVSRRAKSLDQSSNNATFKHKVAVLEL